MAFRGTQRDDVYLGTSDDELIEGLGGDDRLGGGLGDDRIFGGSGTDTLYGGSGEDTLEGGAGDDVLFSNALSEVIDWNAVVLDDARGRDTLRGGDGDDTIVAGSGDTVDGGVGADRLALSLKRESAGLTIDLDALTGGGAVLLGTTSVTGVEGFVAVRATEFADDIRYAGSSTIFRIDAGSGDDYVVVASTESGVIEGGAGNDRLQGGLALSGGDGDDRLSGPSTADGGAGDDLITGCYNAHGGDGDDQISAELGSFVSAFGEVGDDTLTGSGSRDSLFGGEGADVVIGGGGDDIIRAAEADGYVEDTGSERDRVDAGSGNDFVSIGYGDRADGGAGYDRLELSLLGGGKGVRLDLAALVGGGTVTVGGATISGFEEFAPVTGTNWNDRVTVSGQIFLGAGGNDCVSMLGTGGAIGGGGGDDTIFASGKAFGYSGDAGRDTLDFSNLSDGVALEIDSTGAGLGHGGSSELFDGFEIIVGTDFNDGLYDSFETDLDTSFAGGAGDDYMGVSLGTDNLSGGAGDDTIQLMFERSASMGDRLNGGAGNDRIYNYFDTNLSAVTLTSIEWLDIDPSTGANLTIASRQAKGVTRIDATTLRFADAGIVDLRHAEVHATIYLNDGGTHLLLGQSSFPLGIVYGGSGDDVVLSADPGSSNLWGGGGDDVLSLAAAASSYGSASLIGGDGDDRLIGGGGGDVLIGGAGADRMEGGGGGDRYLQVDGADTIHEAADGGTDTVETAVDYTLGVNVENLLLTGAAARGTGNAGVNTITGNFSDNVLNGKADADVLIGGGGNDRYVVDDLGDRVVEDESAFAGTDTVYSSLSFTLGNGVEQLVLTAAGNIGRGNALDNTLTGSAGADVLHGLGGNDVLMSAGGSDRLIGGDGDDLYHVDDTGDVIVEQAGGGADRVIATAAYTLSAQVESLELREGARFGRGNNGANVLIGSNGNDTLQGMGGGDVLTGGSGKDTLSGGTGQDALYGNGGPDRFVFARGDSSADWQQADGIVDFSHSEGDRIDLSGFGHLTFVGAAEFSGRAQVRFEEFDGDTLISIDRDGDRIADAVIGLIGSAVLTAVDFILA